MEEKVFLKTQEDKRYRGRGIKKIREIEKRKGINLTGRLVFLKGRSTNGFLVKKVSDRKTEKIAYLESLEGELVMHMSEQLSEDVYLVKEEYEDLVFKIIEITEGNIFKSKSYLGRLLNKFKREKLELNRATLELLTDLYVYYMLNDKENFKKTLDKLKAFLI